MYISPRHQMILDLAKTQERVLVDELAERFELTPQTIRKDLNELCEQLLLTRIHGGAKFPSGVINLEYEERKTIASEPKLAIGKAVAALIPEKSSVFINIGTTTEAVSEALLNHESLMVVTTNINVGNKMRVYPKFNVIIAGGVIDPTDGGILGEMAVDFINLFKVDYAVLGCAAIDSDGGVLVFDMQEVKVAQAMLNNARNVILVADSTKFDRNAPVRIAHIRQTDTFVTDHCSSENVRIACFENDVNLIEVYGKAEDPAE